MVCKWCNKIMSEVGPTFFSCTCGRTARKYNGGAAIYYDQDGNAISPPRTISQSDIIKIEEEIEEWKKQK